MGKNILGLAFKTYAKVLKTARGAFIFSFTDHKCCMCGRDACFDVLCNKCKLSFFSFNLSEQRCSVCGKKLLSEKSVCTSCRSTPLVDAAECVLPLYSYRLWNKKLLFDWKIKGLRSLSVFFAKAVAAGIRELYPHTEFKSIFIVPVPPRKHKVRNYGWDQIQELCSYLKYCYGFSVLHYLERISTVQQKKLDRKERLDSRGRNYILSKAFYSAKKQKNLPESVVLLDDVITTGVTVGSCADLLKKEGLKVKILSLFIVD